MQTKRRRLLSGKGIGPTTSTNSTTSMRTNRTTSSSHCISLDIQTPLRMYLDPQNMPKTLSSGRIFGCLGYSSKTPKQKSGVARRPEKIHPSKNHSMRPIFWGLEMDPNRSLKGNLQTCRAKSSHRLPSGKIDRRAAMKTKLSGKILVKLNHLPK